VNNDLGLTIILSTKDRQMTLDLRSTKGVIATSLKHPSLNEKQRVLGACEWQGVIRGMEEESMVALSTCPVLRGIIMGEEAEILVEPAFGSASLNDSHLMYSAAILDSPVSRCGVNDSVTRTGNWTIEDNTQRIASRNRRSILSQAHGPLWTNKLTRFVELVLVVDQSFYQTFREEVYSRCRGIVNIVNAVFRDLHIVVVLTDIEVWSDGDKIQVSSDHVGTLENLSKYRVKMLKENIGTNNDNTILLT
ncbi:hypothetical protein SK128_005491, partial [Halocaridina rubra]